MLGIIASAQAASALDDYPNPAIINVRSRPVETPTWWDGLPPPICRTRSTWRWWSKTAPAPAYRRSRLIAKAAPDGYTLCICGVGSMTVAVSTEKLPYDPLKDLTPISLVNTNPLMLVVNPKLEAKTAAEVVTLSKSAPGSERRRGRLRGPYAVRGGDFRVKTNFNLIAVPCRGGALATAAVVSGEVQLACSACRTRWGKGGRHLAALAITTAKRSPHTPEIPTLLELGLVDYPGLNPGTGCLRPPVRRSLMLIAWRQS